MSQLDQQVANRLTRFYMLALAILALLAISGLVFIRHTISTHYDDSRVVNVAGRQRMLSQRLTKLALLRTVNLSAADTVSFDSLLRTWSQSHIQLRNGTLRMEKTYTVRKSPTLDSMFTRIEPEFQAINRGFAVVRQPGATPGQRQQALALVLQHELSFLQLMNEIVFQFDTESFTRVRSLERIEWLLTTATLLTLLLEGFLVFRPVVRYAQHVVRRLDRSERSLQAANGELEQANQELLRANHQLVATQKELLQITEEKYQLQLAEETIRSAALLEGQEDERRRFARELHDGIGQMLTGLKLHAEKLKSTAVLDDKQRSRFADLCELIYDIIQTTRQVSYNLMPSTLSDFGLGASLHLLVEQTSRSVSSQLVYEGPRDGQRLPPAVEIGLYRIAQEALNNAIKHADAPQIRIQLQQTPRQVVLSVQDTGKGFSLKTSTKAARPPVSVNGLDNMRTRTRLLNGQLTIRSKPKQGTEIKVCLYL
ncbi:histidine kinase [Fibrella aestuarina BUZ 2]|uniref:histidine kinase n=1 Tax=Fibrella aestuarina BUZ 2 TaxID=1166018 RepID=I0KDX5_9BACT|nr:ATP-binding protein [Fibrella aestuarina]CCH02328.1 histidine kinase [Fibrella aestuarina BUZ 2]